ncbi:MAG: c-type cytochrome [Steroidobacteraceae bacterium]|jgi:cytochrome c553|nr:c-type cytochrome [Steroidobacteraceae bacterium]
MNTRFTRDRGWLSAVAATLVLTIGLVPVSLPAAADGPRPAAAPADRAAAPGAVRATARNELRDAMLATPDPRRGEELYAPCGACHGAAGLGVADGSVPAIAGQHFTVVAKQLVDFRHGRRWDIQMEHASRMAHLAGGQDIADVAAFVATLPRGFGSGHGDGSSLGTGAATYFERCERCHGPLGEGDGERGIPRLAGQHYAYLYRQFFDAVEQRRPNMGALHLGLMKPLERAQIVGISDYLSRTGLELTRERP